MGSLNVPRRQFLRGFASLTICAPAVVRASRLMRVSARFYRPSPPPALRVAPQDALALLQHEMERRFTETLFGEENVPAEPQHPVLADRAPAAEAKITALWELRMLFGPRGSPPRPLEDLPADARASLFSILRARPDPGVEP